MFDLMGLKLKRDHEKSPFVKIQLVTKVCLYLYKISSPKLDEHPLIYSPYSQHMVLLFIGTFKRQRAVVPRLLLLHHWNIPVMETCGSSVFRFVECTAAVFVIWPSVSVSFMRRYAPLKPLDKHILGDRVHLSLMLEYERKIYVYIWNGRKRFEVKFILVNCSYKKLPEL